MPLPKDGSAADTQVLRTGSVDAAFKSSTEFTRLAASMKRSYTNYLKLIESDFGDLPLQALEDRRMRGEFKSWRDQFADKPRKADYVWSVLAAHHDEPLPSRWTPLQVEPGLATLRVIMRWYDGQDDDYRAPNLAALKRKRNNSRDRVLDAGEIRQLWHACNEMNDESLFYGAFVKLLLLTAQRSGKVKLMRWQDIDEHGIWKAPTEHREKGHITEVRLPAMALDILNKLERRNDFVFPAEFGNKPMNAFSQRKEQLAKILPIPHWTLHDLRRTARTLMSDIGIMPHIAERTLGHKIKGVEGAYDRHKYTVQKSKALEQLADKIGMIINPPEDNIVPLRKGVIRC